jgi:putative membrane protein
MMGHAAEGWGWMSGFGWIVMILFWALIVLCVVALGKWIFSTGDPAAGRRAGRSLDILKERYARGEINRDQYEQMRRDLAT